MTAEPLARESNVKPGTYFWAAALSFRWVNEDFSKRRKCADTRAG